MSDEPLVSIIMNCYNSDEYLEIALKSVIGQTYKNWELIFWDNQSTDNSAKISQSFDDDRIKYHYAPKHTSLGEARNLAIEKTQGEWVAILDCDDIWHEDKIKDAFNSLKNYKNKNDVALIYSKTQYIDEHGKAYMLFKEAYSGRIHDLLLKRGDFIFISSAIFKKSVLSEVGKIDASLYYAEDYDLVLKISKNYECLCIEKYQTSYRVHSNNLTNSKVYEYDIENFEFLKRYAKNNNLSKSLQFSIFVKNSERMTASIVKLILKKEYGNLFKMITSYPQYMMLFPYYICFFIVKYLKKEKI